MKEKRVKPNRSKTPEAVKKKVRKVPKQRVETASKPQKKKRSGSKQGSRQDDFEITLTKPGVKLLKEAIPKIRVRAQSPSNYSLRSTFLSQASLKLE